MTPPCAGQTGAVQQMKDLHVEVIATGNESAGTGMEGRTRAPMPSLRESQCARTDMVSACAV